MNQELLDRFDRAIATLKPIEPSAYFDFEFRRRLEAVVSERYREAEWKRVARRAIENLKFAFLPKVPALARTFAAFVAVVTTGVYLYTIQPANPIVGASEGIVLAKGLNDSHWVKVGTDYVFKAGDIITTKEGSHVDIIVSKRYAARIKDNSLVRIASLTTRRGKGTALFELENGRMLVDIQPGFKPSNFVINTKAGAATALGTKFSVDSSRKEKDKMNVEVLEGKVEVKSSYEPKATLLAKRVVFVGAGQKTEVVSGSVPFPPERLMDAQWRQLEELYQIRKKPQVILLIKNTPDRVTQLLKPCPIYISDEKPRRISSLLEKTVREIEIAIKAEDMSGHLKSIKMLELIVKERPAEPYNAQLLSYIASYYEYIGYHKDAIAAFERVVKEYPESTFASIAQCAIGIIYEEKLKDAVKSEKAYGLVLQRYPNSLEAIWLEGRANKKI